MFTQEIYPIPKLAPSVYSDIRFLEIGTDGVVKQLKNLKQNKATGRDELSARVLTIYKKSLTSDPANYRPISLTCILCKVMRHIILQHVETHKDNVILHFQHGFQSGLSCESQLIETVHDWITAIDTKSQIDAITF